MSFMRVIESPAVDGLAAGDAAVPHDPPFAGDALGIEPVAQLAHGPDLAVETEDAADGCGFLLVDHRLAVVGVASEGRIAAHSHVFLLGGGDLVAYPLPVTFRSNWAKERSTLRVSRPIEVLVYDDVDDAVPALRRMGGKRIRGYESLGYRVERPGTLAHAGT